MYATPMMLPFDADGVLYAIEDEQGKHIATGSREVCRQLLQLISHGKPKPAESLPRQVRRNVVAFCLERPLPSQRVG